MTTLHVSTMELATAQHLLLGSLAVIVATDNLVNGLLLGAVALTGQVSAMRALAAKGDS